MRAKVLANGVQIAETLETARKGRTAVVAAVPASTELTVNTLPASQNTTPGFWITEDQFIHLLQDVWAMGYAVVPSMPIEESVVRTCYESLSENFCLIEFPGDLFDMMHRVAERDDAKKAAL